MDCTFVRDNLPAYRTGDVSADETREIQGHLDTCPACMAESRETQSALSLLSSLPEITPSPSVWKNVSTSLGREVSTTSPSRKAAAFVPWLRLAAAASIVVAAISFLYVGVLSRSPVATVSHVMPGSDTWPGRTLRAGETFTASAYTVLTLPGVGTLKLNRGTILRLDGPRAVSLESGDLFADIIPGGRGFQVASRDAVVTVHGTKFGVNASNGPSTVYVVEGKVAVKSNGNSVTLTGNQMASVGAPAKALEDEALRWIATHEAPVVALRIESQERSLRRGGPAVFRLSFSSTSPAPVYLEPTTDLPRRLTVTVTDPAGRTYLANLDGCVAPVHARQGTDGRARVDVSSALVLDCRLTVEKGFETPGTYRLAVSYDGLRTPGGSGTVIPSDPLSFEVRD